MDFWSRLIGGSRSVSAKPLRASSPTERLAAFKRICNTLQQIWRSSNLPPGETAAHARVCIERMSSILGDESRGPAPHPCMAYASSSQVFVTVTKLSLMSYDSALVRAAAAFFNTLIDAEVDGVIDNRIFARALVDLVRRTDKRSEDVDGKLIELLFGVANNIRLQPSNLSAWFVPKLPPGHGNERQGSSEKEFEGATRRDDFPLFYLLIDYVHHEGHAGDFARTGLLYLIETASRSKDLEKWLIESDLATLMATGLGALYSQLGSLYFGQSEDDIPLIITLSDHDAQDTAVQPCLGSSMDSFMSYLLFWQDAIDHCKSAEVAATLLDHFQVLFLEQLLYPSLLESSDVEGGSTAAVLTYLCRILASIHQSDMVHRILRFLLASPSDITPASPTRSMYMSVSRRKSLDVLAAFSEGVPRPSPSLFNLKDLVLLGLRSMSRQTILATLRLLSVILCRHPSFTTSLIQTAPGKVAKQRTVGAVNAELKQLLSLASSTAHDRTVEISYENYLKDASCALESRLCMQLAENNTENGSTPLLELQLSDPIIQELVNCLGNFFANSVVINLALTEALMSTVSSYHISLDGWVLVDPSLYDYTVSSSEQQITEISSSPDVSECIKFAYEEPTWRPANTPVLISALQILVDQAVKWKKTIPDFDVLVAARRTLLQQEDGKLQLSESPTNSNLQQHQKELRDVAVDTDSPQGRLQPLKETEISLPLAAPVDSPLQGPSAYSVASRDSSTSQAIAADELQRRLATRIEIRHPRIPAFAHERNANSRDPANCSEMAANEEPRAATLSHILTNIVILYEFLLELSAMVQVRASLFEEAGFPMNDLCVQMSN